MNTRDWNETLRSLNVGLPDDVERLKAAGYYEEAIARIDAYLAGSPLEGQGVTFATAAWNNGVDPRWSPAISNTESSKGLYCSGSCNAWGWASCRGTSTSGCSGASGTSRWPARCC